MSAAGLKHRFTLAIALVATVLLAPLAAQAQIAFRAAASASVQSQPPAFRAASSSSTPISFVNEHDSVSTSGSISISNPCRTADGGLVDDMNIAYIAVTPSTATITAPSGWTQIRRIDNTNATSNSLAVFRKTCTASDNSTSSYSFTVTGSTNTVGGITAYRNVHLTTPVDFENGVNTASALTHAAPSVTTTVANTILHTVYAFASASSGLSVPSGSQNGVDSSGTSPAGISYTSYRELILAAGATGTRTATASGSAADVGNTHSLALKPAASPLLRIPRPAGTVADDVMIASVGVTPSTTTITAPAGWTEVRRINNGSATTNSLVVYRKTAGASEPAYYDWTLSGASYAAGGIQSFSGIDTANPVDVENGQATASGTAHATPDVTTTVGNTILVTSHTYASSRTWSAPSGMTEAFDRPNATNNATGQSTAGYYVVQAAAGATGAKSASAAGDGDRGNAHILALRPVAPQLTINKPAGTVANDVMIAAVGLTPSTASITPPAGWTLVRRTDNASATSNSLVVYYRIAGASEPASYTWALSGITDAAGGIQSFSGVDTSAAVNVENGQTTSSSTSHATPSVTPTVANTMLVTAHTFASSATWTPPSGMTEAYDQASLAVPNSAGLSIAGSYQPHIFLATGTKTATASGNADNGNAHILVLRPLPVAGVAGGFNAYDTTTAAGANIGFVTTKIAGTTVSVAIIALNLPRTAIQTDFTGTARVEVLNASDNSGALDAYGCRSSWTVLQTLPDATFAAGDSGRKTVTFTEANSYPDLRLRVSFPTASPTRIGCSNDNFALRPNTFTSYSVTDDTWTTAGTTRTLNNTTLPGGTVHKAGQPFTVRATAVNGAGTPATTTNYTGAPTPTLTDCGASSACPSTLGTVTLGASFVAGVLTANTASYENVGSFNMQLVDATFSNVDATDGSPADCTASGRYVCSSTLAVGRFVPDNFAVALNTPSFGTACGSFTYIGQKFNYATAPVITVTARNFAGGTTTNYAGALWQITNASLTGKSYTAAAGTLDVSGLPGTDPVIASAGSGTGTLTFGSGTGLFFTRTTPVAPFDADISLAINVIDADGVTLATNPARFGTATAGNGIAFSSGKPMRFGRLTIRNANGSQLMPLLVRVEAQYWSGAPTNTFITNTLDNCTSIASANDAMGNYTGNLSGSPTCETAISGGGALSAGRRTLLLAAPGSGNSGSVDLTVNLGAAASGSTCTTLGGAPGSATTANLPHLQGNWSGSAYDQNPTARATFGVYKGAEEVIFIRENY